MASNDGVNVQLSKCHMKLRKSEHFVSCTMVLDKAFWDLEITQADDSYISDIAKNGGFVSQKFTADDDGEVFWRIRVTYVDADENEPNFKVQLDAEFNRTDIHVLGYAVFEHDVNSPFHKKPLGCVYDCLLLAPKICAISDCGDDDLDSGFEEFRVDVSYAIVDWVNTSKPRVPLTESTNKQLKSLASGVAALLDNHTTSDVILRCDGVEWKLHKTILAASSKIFAAMFSHEMKESAEGVVDIEDVDNKVFDLMIKFVYNADVDESKLKKAAEDLLILADRYDLPVLKETCEEILTPQLSVENCLRLFLLGQKHSSPPLLSSAKRFLTRNFSKICRTEEYNDFARENIDLLIEVTRDLKM